MKLWVGQAVSIFGTEVTSLALPLTAVLLLKATPLQMGLLGAVGLAPYVLFSLVAGVWVDRLRRRPLLIAADLGRAVLLASIPVSALPGLLTMGQLYIVGFLVGALNLVFGLAYQSFLSAVVGRDRLVEGNGKLAMSASTGQVAGPGLGGALVQLLTAPVAILVDAISYLVSAAFIALVRASEPPPRPRIARGSLRAEIGEGFRTVARQPVLRALTASSTRSPPAWRWPRSCSTSRAIWVSPRPSLVRSSSCGARADSPARRSLAGPRAASASGHPLGWRSSSRGSADCVCRWPARFDRWRSRWCSWDRP